MGREASLPGEAVMSCVCQQWEVKAAKAEPVARKDGTAAASCSALLMSPLMLSGAAGGAREKGLVLRGGECGDGSVHGGLGSGGR